MSNIYSDDVITLINTIGINQAGAAQVALALYEERARQDILSFPVFSEWLHFKFEEAPYDEFE